MRILFIFPYCSHEINSIAYGPIYLGSIGHQVLVITAQNANSLKGKVHSLKKETIGNTIFFRPYFHSRDIATNNPKYWPIAIKFIIDFDPEVIIGFGESNYKLSLKIKKNLKIPLLFFLEYINKYKPFPPIKGRKIIRNYFNSLYNLISKNYLRKIVRGSDAVMFSYFGDLAYTKKITKYGKKAFYVPWCNEIERTDQDYEKNLKTVIYIGSVTRFKNAGKLLEVIPKVLLNTSIEKFIVIGPGEFANEIKDLAKIYPGKLLYFESLPRKEALKLLASAGFGFTPVIDSGLGFIGDCWAVKTPLIALNSLNGFLNPDIDTIIINDIDNLPFTIEKLISNKLLYNKLQNEGYKRYFENFSARAVGEKYLDVINQVLNK